MSDEMGIFVSETLETEEGELVMRLVPIAVGMEGVAELAGTRVPFLVVRQDAVEITSKQGGHDITLGKASVHLNDGGEGGDGSWFDSEDERAGKLLDLRLCIERKCYTDVERSAAIMLVSPTRNVYVGRVSEGRGVGNIFDPKIGI